MKERIIFGGIGAVIAVSAFLFASPMLILALVAVISIMAVTEFLKAVGIMANKDKQPLNILTYLLTAAIIISMAYGFSSTDSGYTTTLGYSVIPVILYIILGYAVMVLRHGKINFVDVAMSLSGALYISMSLIHIYLLRSVESGKLYLWLPFIIAWLTDTFAYFTGVFFGKHKLIPSVSPKKTIEGAIGGITGAVITVFVFQLVCSKIGGLEPDYLAGVIMALVCSVASQFGDLSASCIKREHGIKDFGSIMPGHGGVLDRFDSVIFISPIVFLIINYIGIFR